MKIIFLTGSHYRHKYMSNKLKEASSSLALITQERGPMIPGFPEIYDDSHKNLFITHFSKREEKELEYFGNFKFPDCPTLKISKEEINSKKVIDFIKSFNPDFIFSYGVSKLSNEVINLSSKLSLNIHGGLSPWYRGNITHFWPSYRLEPQKTGMTMHLLTQDIDHGLIVHQSVSPLKYGDTLHDISCKAVISMGKDIVKLLNVYILNGKFKLHQSKTSGRIYRSIDWRPEHLKLIYETYQDKIVDFYLDKKIQNTEVKYFNQFL